MTTERANHSESATGQTQTALAHSFPMPTNYQETQHFCQMLARSSIVPSSFKNDTMAVWACIERGMRQGYSILQSLQNIAVINGKPQIYGDEPLACVRRSGALEYIKETIEGEGKGMVAICIAKRRGDPTEIRREWTVEDAQKAGKWGSAGPWTTYPKRMLQMKARNFALRDGFGDVLGGAQILGEGEDIPETARLLEKTMVAEDKAHEPVEQKTGLDVVLKGIGDAQSLQYLDEVATMARKLPEAEAAKARTAFADKRRELGREPEQTKSKAQRVMHEQKQRFAQEDVAPGALNVDWADIREEDVQKMEDLFAASKGPKNG